MKMLYQLVTITFPVRLIFSTHSFALFPEVVYLMLSELTRTSPIFGEIVASVMNHRDPATRPRATDVFKRIQRLMKKA